MSRLLITGALPTPEPAKKKSHKKRLPKVISAGEATRLLAAADDGSSVGLRNRLMLEMMYRAGLRVSEVTKLAPRQVESDGIIHIYDAKGGDGTAYFQPEKIMPLMERWMPLRERWARGEELPLFINRNGTPVSVRYLQRLVKKLKAEIGLVGILTPHVLRHTYATELIEDGFPIHDVQRLLRHANLQTTAIYLSIRDEQLRRRATQRGPRY